MMNFEKKYWLIVVALACIFLYYYGSENIPHTEKLPVIGGLAFGINTLINLTK